MNIIDQTRQYQRNRNGKGLENSFRAMNIAFMGMERFAERSRR